MAAGRACGTATGLLVMLGPEQERHSGQPQKANIRLIRLSAVS